MMPWPIVDLPYRDSVCSLAVPYDAWVRAGRPEYAEDYELVTQGAKPQEAAMSHD